MNSIFKLDTYVWEITRKCNFSCEYRGSRAGKADFNELDIDKCLDIVKQLVEMKYRRMVLIGGEVFLKVGWERITFCLVASNIDCSIITNGYLINEEIIDKLIQTNIKHVSVFIDGYREIHDEFRSKGSFDKALEAIKPLKKNNFIVSVIPRLNSKNIDTIDALYETLKRLDIDAWQLQSCSLFGNATEKKYLISTKNQLQGVCDFVAKNNLSSSFSDRDCR